MKKTVIFPLILVIFFTFTSNIEAYNLIDSQKQTESLQKQISSSQSQISSMAIGTTIPTPTPSPSSKISPCVVPPDNLVSWWPGDTNASDIARESHKNNGVLNGTTILSNGKVAGAFSFDGINDYMEVQNDSTLVPSTNAFTFDYWLKPTLQTTFNTYQIFKDGTYSVVSDGLNLTFTVFGVNNTYRSIYTTTTPLSLNNWNFIAVTYDGSQNATNIMKIYVNGIQIPTMVNLYSTTILPTSLSSTSSNLLFGSGSNYGFAVHLKGYMDEIEFFNRGLSQIELQSIFNADRSGKCKEKVILMGGSDGNNFNDVYQSYNGKNWNLLSINDPLPTTKWSPRIFLPYNSKLFNNKIWVVGGSDNFPGSFSDVWSSSNGSIWNLEHVFQGCNLVASHTLEIFNNKLRALRVGSTLGLFSDLWSSSDGSSWLTENGTQNSTLPAGSFTASVVAYGKIWSFGGYNSTGTGSTNEIWSSVDGITWQQEIPIGTMWEPRYGLTSLFYNNKIWILGGEAGFSNTNNLADVWSSSDGLHWTEVLYDAPWSLKSSTNSFYDRYWHSSFVLNGKMFIVAGATPDGTSCTIPGSCGPDNDIWSSNDGITWTQIIPTGTVFSPRLGFSTVVVPSSFGL